MHDISLEEKRTAKLTMTLGNLARVNESGNSILYSGKYTVLSDVLTQAEIHYTLVGKETILNMWPQPPNNTTGMNSNSASTRRNIPRGRVKLT